jgi:hypothetical protein
MDIEGSEHDIIKEVFLHLAETKKNHNNTCHDNQQNSQGLN